MEDEQVSLDMAIIMMENTATINEVIRFLNEKIEESIDTVEVPVHGLKTIVEILEHQQLMVKTLYNVWAVVGDSIQNQDTPEE